jgi:hypothetical protein
LRVEPAANPVQSSSAICHEGHPPFAAFASGLLAYKHTPDDLRNDRELQREFPPRRLKGLADGWLNWRSPETLARDRRMLALGAAADARLLGA